MVILGDSLCLGWCHILTPVITHLGSTHQAPPNPAGWEPVASLKVFSSWFFLEPKKMFSDVNAGGAWNPRLGARWGVNPYPKHQNPMPSPNSRTVRPSKSMHTRPSVGLGLHIKDSMGDEILPSCKYSY